MSTATTKETATDKVPAIDPAPPRGEFRYIPVAQLQASRTNPRKHFDDAFLRELADSIKTHGIVQPITVRQLGVAQFEIVAGEQRWRAAQMANLATVPAIVRELTDAQVIEIQIIENLQRKDIRPLEEANSFARLMDKAVMGASVLSAEQIAQRIGKSKEYVYARTQLLKLGDKARTAFETENLPTEHGVIISRLNEGDQQRAIKACLEHKKAHGQFQTVREVREMVEEHIKLANDQQTIAAKLAEAKANKEQAVPITAQPSWYGHSLTVVPYKGTIYSDQYKLAGERPCEGIVLGVYVDRKDIGKVVQICIAAKCKTHWPQPKAAKKTKKGAAAKPGTTKPTRGIDDPEIARAHKAREAARNRAIGLVFSKSTFDAEDLRFVAYLLSDVISSDVHDEIAARHKLKPDADINVLIDKAKTRDALTRLILEFAYFSVYYDGAFSGDVIGRREKFEKRYGIYREKFEAEALAELEAQEKPAAGKDVQTSTKLKAAKTKKAAPAKKAKKKAKAKK